MSKYDYICPECTHEFDYSEGVHGDGIDKYFECPHCRVDITYKLIDNEETHNNS